MYARRRRRQLIIIPALIVAIALVEAIAAIAGNSAASSKLYPGPLKYVQKYPWQITGAAIVVGVMLAVVQWLVLSRKPDQTNEAHEQLDQAAQLLAATARAQWTDEAEKRSLWRPEPLNVKWAFTSRPLVAPTAEALGGRDPSGQRLQLRGNASSIIEAFKELRLRQLAILGNSGAGKTVLAILLLLGLLNEREPGEPIPVLVSLASWDPRSEHLNAWLARRMVEDYTLADNILDNETATRLVAEHRVMPILDGLDEMSPEWRAEAIDAIDRSVVGEWPLVVTCRSDEYEAAVAESGAFLRRTAVVEVEPVEIDDAIAFLTSTHLVGDERWQPIFDHLRRKPRSALARTFSVPLMIDLARTLYAHPSTNPVELLDPTRFGTQTAIEKHLFDMFILTVYANRPSRLSHTRRSQYDVKKAQRWLSFLARYLNHLNTTEFFWWNINSGILYTLVPSIIFGAGAWIIFTLIFGPLLGCIGGLTMGLIVGASTHFKWSTAEFLPLQRYTSGDPQVVLRRLRSSSMVWTLSAGFIIGLSIGLWLGLALHVGVGRTVLFGSIFAAMLGLGGAARTLWADYLIACTRFGLTRTLPLRLIRFLDDARQRGVLRQTGVAYQFRHARLQESLASRITSSARLRDAKHRKTGHAVSESGHKSPTRILLARLVPYVAIFVAIFAFLSVFAIYGTISYASGYAPKVTYNNEACGPGVCPPSISEIVWLLPPAGKEVTVFTGELDSSLPYDTLSLHLQLDNCVGASVAGEVTAKHKTFFSRRFSQEYPSETTLPRTVLFPKAITQFTVSFRRLDNEKCTAQLTWKAPNLTNSFWANLGQSFRH